MQPWLAHLVLDTLCESRAQLTCDNELVDCGAYVDSPMYVALRSARCDHAHCTTHAKQGPRRGG